MQICFVRASSCVEEVIHFEILKRD